MNKREFLSLVGGAAAAWPLAASAQQPARLPLVAILRSEVAGDSEGLRNSGAVVQGLQALGWTEGRNLRIEKKRWAGGSVDAMKTLARELVALERNVIVVHFDARDCGSHAGDAHNTYHLWSDRCAPAASQGPKPCFIQFLGSSRTSRAFIAAFHFYAGTRNKMCHFPP